MLDFLYHNTGETQLSMRIGLPLQFKTTTRTRYHRTTLKAKPSCMAWLSGTRYSNCICWDSIRVPLSAQSGCNSTIRRCRGRIGEGSVPGLHNGITMVTKCVLHIYCVINIAYCLYDFVVFVYILKSYYHCCCCCCFFVWGGISTSMYICFCQYDELCYFKTNLKRHLYAAYNSYDLKSGFQLSRCKIWDSNK